MFIRFLFVFLVGSFFYLSAQPKSLELASLFQDNMVLQQRSKVPFWGWSTPNDSVTITSSWNKTTKTVITDKFGKFDTELETISYGGPYFLNISSKSDTITIDNVMLGEVWLASGQSNMGWDLRRPIVKASELDSITNMDQVRFFKVPNTFSLRPNTRSKGEWRLCNPANAAEFSAVAYFFSKKLTTELNVPIGIIQSVWGGTPVESWMPLDYAEKIERFVDFGEQINVEILKESEYLKWLDEMRSIDVSDKRIEEINEFLSSILPSYHQIDIDDSKWSQHQLPSKFEKKFGEMDPLIWYRKEFYFNSHSNEKTYDLFLGPIDDLDVVFLNGVKIGQDVGWQKDRIYEIPKGLLQKGKNIISISVLDNGGGGGIYKKTPKIKHNDKVVFTLSGAWKYKMLGCFENKSSFKVFDSQFNLDNKPNFQYNQKSPSSLYNAMIAPLIPYKIKGVIWYQGEKNVSRAQEYFDSFPLLINSWRNYWKQGDIPFYYVQIAPYNYGSGKAPVLRESQRLAMKLPNTGMVVTSDIGDVNDIHPKNKHEVGNRLALWALNKDYGFANTVYTGPLYEKISIEGQQIRIHFEGIGSGLYSPDKLLNYFEVAGKNQTYYPAKAFIEGNNVIVRSPKVKSPKSVRFGWTDTAIPNLFNKEGLPASSFSSEMIGKEGNQISKTPFFFTKNLIEEIKPDSTVIYKTINNLELELHFFFPPNHQMTDKKPAIVFFHGGGWKNGKPAQFYMQCKYLASRGMVAMSAQYRTRKYNGTTPKECVKDGKSTMRWIRKHATQYGINPNLLAAGGGSAGGHIAAATATLDGFNEEGEDTSVSCIPNALVLFNPVINNSSEGYGYDRVKPYWKEFSPHHNLHIGTPPTIFMVGTEDKLVKRNIAKQYKNKMEELGLRCDLIIYEGANHGFFNKKKNEEKHYQSLVDADRFLISLKYLNGKPAIMHSLRD
jgi:sialate O-acetylesterase